QLRRGSEADLACIGLFRARQHPEQGRLAGPIGSDDAHDAASWQVERKVVDQQPLTISLPEVGYFDHQVAEAFARWAVDLLAFIPGPRGKRGPRGVPGAPCSWPGGPSGSAGPTRARVPRSCARPRARALRGPGAAPSAPARMNSCHATGYRGPGRAPGSTRPR